MTGGGSGGAGACAVCKHQRRKCEPNCELAAYFPANRMNDFRALHLVFGVANLTKLIKANATEAARRRAAETLTWEARWRERDPPRVLPRGLLPPPRQRRPARRERRAPPPGRPVRVLRRRRRRQARLVADDAAAPAAAGLGVQRRHRRQAWQCCAAQRHRRAGRLRRRAAGVRGANGNGAMSSVRPPPHHVQAPATQTVTGFVAHAQDDRYRAVSVCPPAANAAAVPRSGAAVRGQGDYRDKISDAAR